MLLGSAGHVARKSCHARTQQLRGSAPPPSGPGPRRACFSAPAGRQAGPKADGHRHGPSADARSKSICNNLTFSEHDVRVGASPFIADCKSCLVDMGSYNCKIKMHKPWNPQKDNLQRVGGGLLGVRADDEAMGHMPHRAVCSGHVLLCRYSGWVTCEAVGSPCNAHASRPARQTARR